MNTIKRQGYLLIAALFLSGFAAPAQGRVLSIRNEVVTGGTAVLLREMLTDTSGVPEEWLDRKVFDAPSGNQPDVIPITAVAYALQQYPDMRSASLNGGLQVAISRAQRLIMPHEISRAVEEYVALDHDGAGAYKLEFASLRRNVWVPRGATEFRVSPSRMASNHRQLNTYIVDVLVDGNSVCSIPVRALKYQIEPVWVAARPLDSGQLLQEGDLRIEMLPVERKGEQRIPSAEAIAGQEVGRAVRQGMPILRNYLRTPLCARKGDYITVIAEHGNLQISLRARALSTGRLGDRILAENVRSKRQLLIQLTGIQKGRVASM